MIIIESFIFAIDIICNFEGATDLIKLEIKEKNKRLRKKKVTVIELAFNNYKIDDYIFKDRIDNKDKFKVSEDIKWIPQL